MGEARETESEQVKSDYSSKRAATLVASVVESAEDNLLNCFLDLEDSSEMKVSTAAESDFVPISFCSQMQWAFNMFLKNGFATFFFLVCIIIGSSNKSFRWVIGIGVASWLFWLRLLFAHLCCNYGTRSTDTFLSWTAKTFFM
jgi:hypothetical protein